MSKSLTGRLASARNQRKEGARKVRLRNAKVSGRRLYRVSRGKRGKHMKTNKTMGMKRAGAVIFPLRTVTGQLKAGSSVASHRRATGLRGGGLSDRRRKPGTREGETTRRGKKRTSTYPLTY